MKGYVSEREGLFFISIFISNSVIPLPFFTVQSLELTLKNSVIIQLNNTMSGTQPYIVKNYKEPYISYRTKHFLFVFVNQLFTLLLLCYKI